MREETYNRLLDERLNEIQEIRKKIDYNNLTYNFKDSRISSISFINVNISLTKAEEDQQD